jgi:translation initiation factor IF-1
MAKQNDHIKSEGVITQAMGYENFRVRLDNDIEILAVVSGRMRQNHIRLMTGDRVQVEMSPYDLTRGRIVYRYNVKR